MTTISFGDTVRIRATAETEHLGLSGRTGLVQGWTTPSVTGVEVVGDVVHDRALSVKVEGRDDALWLDPDLAEFVDHTAGLAGKFGNRSYRRGISGEWIEDTPAVNDQPQP